MTVGAHLIGWLVVAAVAVGVGVLAVGVRRILLPAAVGAPALLADAVLAVSAVCVLIEAVGVTGGLSRASLVVGALVLGMSGALFLRRAQLGARFAADGAAVDASAGGGAPARATAGGGAPARATAGGGAPALPTAEGGASASATAGRQDGRPGGRPPGRLVLIAGAVVVAAAGAVAGLWFAQVGWTLRHGVLDYDSLNYHLPFALDWYQTGRIGPLVLAAPDSPVGTYPADPELLHAAGMTAFQRDVLTPLLNLGWLALAALAGWTVGRRRGAPLAGLATVVAVASLPVIVQSQPGTAMTDMAVLAALLAGVALLIEAGADRGWLVVSGLAVGLALGSKLTAVAAVAALAVVVIVVARRDAWSWFAGLALTGGFWYVRNLIATGSPIPSLHIPGLPSAHYQAFDEHGESVASKLGNLDLVRTWYLPSLHDAFGPLWPVLLLLIATGVVAAVVAGVRGGPASRLVGLLGAATAMGVVGYLLTPTAGGLLFGTCLRYLLPAGLLGLALVLLVLPAGRFQHLYAGALGAFAIVNVAAGWRLRWFHPSSPRPAVACATGAVALLLGALLLAGQAARRRRAAAGAAAGAAARRLSTRGGADIGGSAPLPDRQADQPEPVESAIAQPVPAARPSPGGPRGQAGQVSLNAVRVPVALLVVGLVVALALPLERFYLNNRYAHAMQVDSVDTRLYAYFRGVSGAKVAVGGVAETYPYGGLDLSNRVDYLGRRQPHGLLTEINDCAEWLGRLAAGRYDYVVVAASAFETSRPPQADWTMRVPRAQAVFVSPRATLIRLNGAPNPASCQQGTGSAE